MEDALVSLGLGTPMRRGLVFAALGAMYEYTMRPGWSYDQNGEPRPFGTEGGLTTVVPPGTVAVVAGIIGAVFI